MKFPPTNGTQAMFQNLESKFYDDKLFFVDSYTDGQQCTTHGNAWSALDPVEMRWCFSNNVKLAHTSFVKKQERNVFYRKTDQGKCDCKLMYEGDEDFILRIGGSSEVKNKNRSIHLITYSLLFDFTLDFFENGTTITGFYKTYHAKCKLKYGMAADNIITLDSWKMAVRIFWKEILKVDMCKSFLCQNCGNLPPTIVFDGIALGCQIKKVKAFQDKMSLVLDRRSKSKLSGTSFSERTYIKSKKNRDLLKHLADEKEWPVTDHTKQISIAKEDIGMIKFMKMISSQDRSGPLPDGIALLMKNLATSSSTTNLFQVLYHFLGFIILAQPFLLCGFRQSNPCFYPTQTILIYSNQSLTLGDRL